MMEAQTSGRIFSSCLLWIMIVAVSCGNVSYVQGTTFFFFKTFKVFGEHVSFFGATGTLFWISGDISFEFQIQSGFCLICFFVEVGVVYIPWDPPLMLHMPTSWQSACSRSLPHMHVHRWELARIWTGNRPDWRAIRPCLVVFLM